MLCIRLFFYICFMNYSLAKEIYGLTPWMVDAKSMPAFTSILNNIQNGVSLEIPEVKLNTPFIYDAKSESKIITLTTGWDLEKLNNKNDFEGIAVINLNGAITKSGGASTVGMEELSYVMLSASKDERIKSFLILTDSGGGSSAAVEIMVDTINEIKQTKPVYSLITKGGMAASAAYGIISATDKIYSESEMNIVGSIGTMIQFEGKKANSEDKDGYKHIRLYATKSVRKNEAFEEALNNDNYDLLINDLLDPVNENFINMIANNRPNIKETTFDDGRTVFSKDAIGTFIDGIASFSEVINMLVSESQNERIPTGVNINSNTNINSKKMTKAELQSNHPELYQEVFSDGVSAERDRVGAWMAHVNTDSEAVSNGIESGEGISQTQREKFLVKQHSQKQVNDMIEGSEGDFITKESTTDHEGKNNSPEKELEEAFNFELK